MYSFHECGIKNAELTGALEKSRQQSTLKKLQDDYKRAKALLDRILPEIIRAYTQRGAQKHVPFVLTVKI